jgi:hypothetical protein
MRGQKTIPRLIHGDVPPRYVRAYASLGGNTRRLSMKPLDRAVCWIGLFE